MKQMTVTELSNRLDTNPENLLLLDVRESWEYDRCAIEGSKLIPMREIPGSIEDLDQDQETVVICHHGVRSFQVASYLERMGFTNIINLYGGVDAWAREVDPTMPIY